MGDAVASFLDEKDPTTVDKGLLTVNDFKMGYEPGVRAWRDQQSHWKDTTSKQRRGVTLTLQVHPIQAAYSVLTSYQVRN